MSNNQFSVDALLSNAVANATQDAVVEMLEKFGLNWTVSKQPLTLPNGAETPFFGVVRDDNNAIFTTCKKDYVPYQNTELAELVMRVADKTGYNVERGGAFNGGAKLYLQLATGAVTGIGKNNDVIKKYATGINSHDGSTSLKWGGSNMAISCKNTFNYVAKELKNKARHTKSIHDVVDASLRQIEAVVQAEKSLFDKYFRMADTPVTKESIVKVAKMIADVDITLTRTEMSEKFSTYSINRVDEFLACLKMEMDQKGETMWGLFSGVTRYTTHTMPAPTRINGREESKFTGSGFRVDNEVFDFLAV